MNEPLRPMTLGEILDRTAQLYRTRFLLFLGISLIPTGVVVVLACFAGLTIAWWSAAGAGAVSETAGYVLVAIFAVGVVLVALPIFLAASALAMAAMSHAVACVHLSKATILDAYKSVWPRGWRYIWLLILEGLMIWAAPLAAWIGLTFLAVGSAAFAQAAGMERITGGIVLLIVAAVVAVIALIGYVIWMALRVALAFPACVVEQLGAWPAIRRSAFLGIGTKGRIFVLFLLVAVLGWLLSTGITMPMTILLALLPSLSSPEHAQIASVVILFLTYGASFAVQALVRPIYGIALMLFYYDQRVRKEGFDIEWMMMQAGMVAAPGKLSARTTEPPQAVEFLQARESAAPTTGEKP